MKRSNPFPPPEPPQVVIERLTRENAELKQKLAKTENQLKYANELGRNMAKQSRYGNHFCCRVEEMFKDVRDHWKTSPQCGPECSLKQWRESGGDQKAEATFRLLGKFYPWTMEEVADIWNKVEKKFTP